jgi:hypothetical protein
VTPGQRVLSFLFAAHMAAVFVGAVQNLDDFGGLLDERIAEPPLPNVAAALDAASVRLIWLHRATWSAIAPLRRLSSGYLGITGQSEQWSMFCNPSRVQQQVRMGYVLRRAGGSSTTEYEGVFPVGAPDEWKIVRSYVDAFEDKPFTSVAGTYRKQHARARSNGIATPTPQMLSTLKPLTRYYGRRRLASGLPPDASLVAVEYWYGVTPMPAPPGSGDSQVVRAARPVPETTWQLWGVDDLK